MKAPSSDVFDTKWSAQTLAVHTHTTRTELIFAAQFAFGAGLRWNSGKVIYRWSSDIAVLNVSDNTENVYSKLTFEIRQETLYIFLKEIHLCYRTAWKDLLTDRHSWRFPCEASNNKTFQCLTLFIFTSMLIQVISADAHCFLFNVLRYSCCLINKLPTVMCKNATSH